ncbi:cupredoxin domain-containing protein [Marinobacter halophilus]|uniref:Plastocyanin n=1 Tax=Marinobacter halophilus TaxID=1323740 RepID=A0A2T1KEK3_9GAMM|nr:plastocyanin/azurin family copper-binding protein [Marinobacter halophilus]PSF08480.1 plastocyanin [Marinobacter halophilus]GGC60962.1 hypothetical protein GCM10011362_06800 [Marinobacter halophilus]
MNTVKSSTIIAAMLIACLPFVTLAADSVEVSIRDFQFIPQEIRISKGTTVRWRNDEKRQYHSVWFEEMGEPEADYFFPGEVYEKTFDETGRLPYLCGPHPRMTGVVIVTDD